MKNYLQIISCSLFLLASTLFSQSGDTNGQWGGVTDVFDFPVGARAMAMGGAHVSVVDDAYSLYWNPAALEIVPTMAFGMYHTNLPMGTQYNYLSFTYPTLNVGTYSAGVLRLTTPDIEIRDDDASLIGSENYGRSLYMLGYGKKITDWLSFGTTLKIDHMRIPGYSNIDPTIYSESSVGADLGLLIMPKWQSGLLRNWVLGLNAQNLFQRTMQFEEEREYSPRMYRIGLSRAFFSDGANYLQTAFELDVNENQHVPNYVHLGFEYSFQGVFMARLGWNRRGNYAEGYGMTYGLGFRYLGIQIDYSYWNGRDTFSGSHRVSAALYLGKTREQKLAEQQEAEMRRIREQAIKQRQEERREAIYSGLARAKQYYEDEDYPRAYSAINKVLAYDDTGEAPEFAEARELAQKINDAMEKRREEEISEQLQEEQRNEQRERRRQQVKEHYEKALAFYEEEQYHRAIEECDQALQYNVDSGLVKDLRANAVEDLKNKILDLVEKAHKLEKRGRIDSALDLFRQALPLSRNYAEMESLISEKIRQLEGRLSYESKLRQASEYELDKQWSEAAALYQEALQIAPNNKLLRQKYEEAKKRAKAKRIDMTPQVREIYLKGYNAMTNKNYDQAIQYFKQALELQPHNANLWGALDYARSERRKQQSASE